MAEQYEQKRLPQFPDPYWRDSVKLPTFPSLTEDIETDVAIVGGGITGITSAYLLSKQGIKTALIDAGSILNGTTGHTTAKVTAQHGLIYDELITSLGIETAKLYYEANETAMNFIKNIVKEEKIDCDLTEEDSYVYTQSDEYTQKLISEIKAYEKLGINGEYAASTTLPFEVKGAVVMKNQAQFHPLKYLLHLVNEITAHEGQIFEQTPVIDIGNGPRPRVIAKNGKRITCNHLIIATHFPFEDKLGFYFARMYADRSYVIAVKTEKEFQGGMYINAEQPTRSIRYTNINGEKLVIFGGDHHKTGQGIDTMKHYEALETFADETFGIREIPYRWSAQDLTTSDKLPFIGTLTAANPNIYVATGFRKWGMTNGTAAAQILSDIIQGKKSPYEEIFNPQRFHAKTEIKNIITTNADVVKHLIEGKFGLITKHPEDLSNDEGAVVTVNGARAGAYKDSDGHLHIVDTTCTHVGCELEWNSGERSWDCPCHGSRFSIDGDVLEGPAEKPLKKIE